MRGGMGLVLALLFLGCAGVDRGPSASPMRDPAKADPFAHSLLPVSDLQPDLLMRQRVTIAWKDREESFEAVLQKRGDVLLLLGLGPMNAVGFSLTLDDRGVEFENRTGRAMPFDPERILADVQRVFYPWLGDASSCLECERRGIREGLEVVERIGPSGLVERRFTPADPPQSRSIVITYQPTWLEDGLVPTLAVLRNDSAGYELTVETDSVERIGSP